MSDFLLWAEGSPIGVLARESLYGFPILVGIHILGLIFSVGMLIWVDLRMIGIALTGSRLSVVYRALAPWFLFGFIVMLVSGGALFAGFASSAYENMFFRIKVVAILIAGINAVMFHITTKRLSESSDVAIVPPNTVRVAGGVSLALWVSVILCGRMMSYTLF